MKSDLPYLAHIADSEMPTRALSKEDIFAFRRRPIHGYWSVDVTLVRSVVEHELPPLKIEVACLIAELRDTTDQ